MRSLKNKKNIYELIEERRSVRSFREDPIPEETLKKILNAARMAPSARNAQEYKLVAVKDAAQKKDLAKAALGQKFIAQAPAVIAIVALNPDYLMESGVPAYPVDAAIAIDHLTLAAAEEGLGTCWIGAFSQEEVKKVLKIPEEYKTVVLLPIGIPKDEPSIKSRKKLSELVCEDYFFEN